jgi:phospholipase/carboxylesterase
VSVDTQLLTYNDWTLRVRHAGQKPARLMLLLHGWTGDENSMWVFARDLPDDYFILAPRGRYQAEDKGYSWREVTSEDWGKPSFESMSVSIEALIQLVDEISLSMDIHSDQFDVMGFSQGGALANMLAVLRPQRVRRTAVLSGFIPNGADEKFGPHSLDGKPFFVAHGSQDPLISFERARSMVSLLERAGAQVTFCEAEVGHRVSAKCLKGLGKFWGG